MAVYVDLKDSVLHTGTIKRVGKVGKGRATKVLGGLKYCEGLEGRIVQRLRGPEGVGRVCKADIGERVGASKGVRGFERDGLQN